MLIPPFHEWLAQRLGLSHVPPSDQVVPIVAATGLDGLTRAQIGHLIDLDREALDELLAGLVRHGVLDVSVAGGDRVYRSGAAPRR